MSTKQSSADTAAFRRGKRAARAHRKAYPRPLREPANPYNGPELAADWQAGFAAGMNSARAKP